MTVTLQPRYGALMMAGHGDPLYVRVVDIPLLVHGQQASLMRIVDGHLVEVGVAVRPMLFSQFGR